MNELEKQLPLLPEAKVPWWQDGKTLAKEIKEPHFVTNGVMAFMRQVQHWLMLPIRQFDPLSCSESILNVVAWDRDITRFNGEPLELFRKRVKYAFINAKDAGEVAGFKRIFERLGIGWVEIHERQDETNWDVINIEVTDSDISNQSGLMQALIEHYGRTCRRYRFKVSYPKKGTLKGSFFGCSSQVFAADLKYKNTFKLQRILIDHSQTVFAASLLGK